MKISRRITPKNMLREVRSLRDQLNSIKLYAWKLKVSLVIIKA